MTYDVDEKGNESSNKVPTNKWEWRIAHYFVLSVPLRYTILITLLVSSNSSRGIHTQRGSIDTKKYVKLVRD
jgi:hypothetical protein